MKWKLCLGEKRLTFYLLHNPQHELDRYADAFSRLKKDTVICGVCKNVGEADPCGVCEDVGRDRSVICVVEQPLDVLAIERAGSFKGLYHVLHGSISPLENIGPDELYIDALFKRIKKEKEKIKEIIIATNPTMEGEATAMYLSSKLKTINGKLKISRLGMGISTGADLEYADEITLTQALEGRRKI